MQIVQIEFYREEIFCFQKFALPQKREDKEVNFLLQQQQRMAAAATVVQIRAKS